MKARGKALTLLAVLLCTGAWAQSRQPDPKRLCMLSDSPTTEQCGALPAAEFSPLSLQDYLELRRETEKVASCVMSFEFKDVRPNFFGENLDDKLWRRIIKAGKAPDLVSEAARLPGYLSPEDAASSSSGLKQANKNFRRIMWGLVEYSVLPQRRMIESARAQALYNKYMAIGTEGTCQPTPAFLSLLDQANVP